MEYRLSLASQDDEAFLKELFFDARAAEFLPLHLAEAALQQLMDMQYRVQKSSYELQFPDAQNSIVWVGPYRVGHMLVSAGAAAIHLIDIGLLPPFRGNGIGRGLLEELCRRASEAGVPLRLTVRTNNRAINLYKRMGFQPRGQTAIDMEMEWGGTATAQTSGEEPIAESGPTEPGLTGAYFRSIVGSKAVFHGAAEPVVLQLAAVRALRCDPDPSVDLGDSFALAFKGDSAQMLAQAVYALEFEDGYRTDIFLVPMAASNGVATYESVFNRMRRKAVVN
jgi:GNAT superfamily N-acetyltransferase